MLIDVRLGNGARGISEAQLATAAVLKAVGEGRLDPAATRVACDWIQYRHNFRQPCSTRAIEGDHGVTRELALDLRRVDDNLDACLDTALGGGETDALYLENWRPASKSCIWGFNALYWQELALWEDAAGRGYAQALPGGESGGTNAHATREVIGQLFEIWDGLVTRHALPDQLTVLELGVGNGEQAKVWLDEFQRLDHERGSDYYRKLQYLMGDSSTHVLSRARATVVEHKSRVSTLVLDAARPTETLRFLESKIFFVYISNVYDNLPSDEVAVYDDAFYALECRAFVPGCDAEALARSLKVPVGKLAELVERLLRLGPSLLAETCPEQFAHLHDAVGFWQEVWDVVRLEERYHPLGPLDLYEVCEDISGEIFAGLVDGHGDLRFHVSNGALASFVDTLPLLHPLGWLTCHDLFVTDLAQYDTGFKGPGKYDGSVVNWVNGPMLQAVAARRGFHVAFAPFAQGCAFADRHRKRAGKGVRVMDVATGAPRPLGRDAGVPRLLKTSVVGSYSVPDWLGRFKSDFHRGRLSSAGLCEIEEVAIKAAIVDQILAGVDIISDGELRRDNEIDYLVESLKGVTITGGHKQDSFDYYNAVVTGELDEDGIDPAGLLDAFRFVRTLTDHTLTVSLAGPFSLAKRLHNEAYRDERDLVLALARLLHHVARALVEAGATHLQIDEPFLAGYPDAAPCAVEAVNLVRRGLDAHVALHVCYGNRFARPAWEGHYDFLFPAVLDAEIDELVLEFARKGLADLELARRYPTNFEIGIGVVDVKSKQVEPTAVIEGRIRQALKVLEPDRIVVNPDCGLRHLPTAVARAKLTAMVQAAANVRADVLGIARDTEASADLAEGRAPNKSMDSTAVGQRPLMATEN